MNPFNQFLLKNILRLNNFSYHLASFLALRREKGKHPKHRLTQYHQFFLNNISNNDRVIDIGCGQGFLAFDLAQKSKFVFGIDIDKKNIEKAVQKYQKDNLKFQEADLFSLQTKERFDVAVLSNVLEHIEKREEFLTKIKELALKILIRVPMENRDWISLYKKELGIEYRLDKGHFIEYTLESFQKEMNQANLKINNYSIQFGEIWAVVYD